jgi:hypothetical protein
VTRRRSSASRSTSSASGKAAGARGSSPKARRDGRIQVSCPQCAAEYLVTEDVLEEKIECTECHRVFFGKSTAGKRVKPPDYTKAYVAFGIGAVAIIGIFVAMGSGGSEPSKKAEPTAAAPKAPQYTLGSHPRALQLTKWAQAIGGDNDLVARTHSDLAALGNAIGVTGDEATILKALREHGSTRYLRELQCDSAALLAEADMTAQQGKGMVFVTPKPGNDDYKKNTRGEIEVAFHMDGEQVKVRAFEVKLKPIWNPNKSDPSLISFKPNADINAPKATEINDKAGARTVLESEPAAVPHWKQATPELQKLADDVVAGILASAAPDAPGTLFNRSVDRVRSMDERKAAVPRILNAMYELYGDVNANNMKLSQLNRALVTITGYAVNYQVENGSDPAKDKKERESCVRQWFAFWWKHHEKLDAFFDSRDNLDEPLDPPKSGK